MHRMRVAAQPAAISDGPWNQHRSFAVTEHHSDAHHWPGPRPPKHPAINVGSRVNRAPTATIDPHLPEANHPTHRTPARSKRVGNKHTHRRRRRCRSATTAEGRPRARPVRHLRAAAVVAPSRPFDHAASAVTSAVGSWFCSSS